MGEQDNLQKIHKVCEAFDRDAVEGVISMLTDDVTWTTPGPPDVIPYAGKKRDHDGVTGYLEAFGVATEATASEPQQFFADDMVVVLGHYTLNVETGKVVDDDFVHTLRLADGRISAFEEYEDSAAVAAAFTAESN